MDRNTVMGQLEHGPFQVNELVQQVNSVFHLEDSAGRM